MCVTPDDSAAILWPRSFLALAPNAATRAHLASVPALPGVKPTQVEDLHLTLAFIGAISEPQRHALAAALPALAELARSIPLLAFTGFEVWPVPDRPRVWVAAYTLPDPMRKLVEQIQAVLTRAGLPVDGRPFRPHITLARFPRTAQACDVPMRPTRDHPAQVDEIGLYCRTATQDGPRYMALARVPLTDAPWPPPPFQEPA
ncbi:RNA 2',3'-cyclic phosphodiesterase [Pigmentiphaga aceris]|nr:RNA 2',3'-cyclic phosphodiesterase [Pigmentiphaga aceris]